METVVEYNLVTDEDLELRRDPAFYVADGHELVATIVKDDREIRVYCDGEMRAHVWSSKEARETDKEPHDIVRYAGDFIDIGINTDKKLYEADENGRMEWGNNAWFDLYACGEDIDDGWLDCVHHDLVEAVEHAQGLINDNELWKELEAK